MAELVIKWGDNHNADAEKDRRGCYKHGDIIDILEDGISAGMPHLTVLKIPKLAKKKKIGRASCRERV